MKAFSSSLMNVGRRKSAGSLYRFVAVLVLALLATCAFAQPSVNISGGTYTNTSGGPESGIVWDSGDIAVQCNGDFTIEYAFTATNGGSPEFQYELNNDGNWLALPATPASLSLASTDVLKIGVNVTDLPAGDGFTFDLKVYEALAVVISETASISCWGLSDGELTAEVKCGDGTPDTYTYQWSQSSVDLAGETSAVLENREAGFYSVTATSVNTPANTYTANYTLSQPAPLNLNYTVQLCFGESGNGTITTTATGGTAPYTVTLNDSENSNEAIHTFNGISTGNNTIDLTDNNGCRLDQIVLDLVEDDVPPVCDQPAADAELLLEDYNVLVAAATTNAISEESTRTLSTPTMETPDLDTLIYTYNAGAYNQLSLSLGVTKNGGDTWDVVDYFEVHLYYGIIPEVDPENQIGSDHVLLARDGTAVLVSPYSLDLPLSAEGKENLNVVIYYFTETGTDKSYTFDPVILTGFNLSAPLLPSETGEPAACTDNQGTVSYTYSDSPVTFVCNDGPDVASEPEEFYFTRTFVVSDGCNTVSYDQNIGIGAFPTIDLAVDDMVDFCHFANIVLSHPAASDVCTNDQGVLDIEWTVFTGADTLRDEINEPVAGSIKANVPDITINLPEPAADEVNPTVYTVRWTARDEAGLTASSNQNVTILPPLSLTFTPVKDNFCSGEEVAFDLVVSGGTGTYQVPVITPAASQPWDDPESDGSGRYTTDQLILTGTETIEVTFTDSDADVSGITVTGGCPKTWTFTHSTDVDAPFTIHQNINTNAITRD